MLTSATLTVGGTFDAVARSVGLTEPYASDGKDNDVPKSPRWRELDVGSPFDYRSQGILYVATHLPPPGRDGISPSTLAEVAELLWAAGRTHPGPVASQRAAEPPRCIAGANCPPCRSFARVTPNWAN